MDFLTILAILLIVLLIGLSITIYLSDCDLTLLFAEKCGKSVASLNNKVVWILGSSSGIGEYLAYELAANGCKLILSARRVDELKRVKDECLRRGKVSADDIFILPVDVTQISNHSALVEQAVNHFGQIDILVNNAGRTQRARWEMIDLEVDRQLFDVNVFGMMSITRHLLPSFISKKSGHVVTMSSLAGKMGVPGSASYTASKHALHGYMESLRWEKSRDNISVTMLCPGPVVSNLLQTAFTGKVGEVAGNKWSMKDKRMPTERCAYLCAVAIANKLDEVWITSQPFLFSCYGIQYLPTVTRKLGSMVGYKSFMKARDGSSAKAE